MWQLMEIIWNLSMEFPSTRRWKNGQATVCSASFHQPLLWWSLASYIHWQLSVWLLRPPKPLAQLFSLHVHCMVQNTAKEVRHPHNEATTPGKMNNPRLAWPCILQEPLWWETHSSDTCWPWAWGCSQISPLQLHDLRISWTSNTLKWGDSYVH